MDTAKYTLYTCAGLALMFMTTGYFQDRTEVREHNERMACIHAHGEWKDVDPSDWSGHYACVFPPQAR